MTPKRKEFSSRRKVRFFDAYDDRKPIESFNHLCARHRINIPPPTGRLWLRQRDEFGDEAYHRLRKTSKELGRKLKVCTHDLDYILDRRNGLTRRDPREIVDLLHLDCHPRTLQASLSNRRNARRYKRRKTGAISKKNKLDRIDYGKLHENRTLRKGWRRVYFTDEVHMDAGELSYSQEWEYAVEGHAEELPVQEVGEGSVEAGFTGKVHCYGGITYDHKGPFGTYKDPKEKEADKVVRTKPRKSSVETAEEHQAKVDAWEFDKFKKQKEIPKGNAMTTKFYTEEILPKHIEFLEAMKEKYGYDFEFVEDGDPSHGMRTSHNMAARLRQKHKIVTHKHPAQSPDFSPIEAMWLIVKERLRGRKWTSREHFVREIYEEWDRITIRQIRKRIDELPGRIKTIQQNGGNRIRSKVW
jgi:hypothetical protein